MYYPWRCLKRGFFLLIIRSTPLRRTILQSALRFLMDALTFMSALFVAYNDTSSCQVIWTHLNSHLIPRKNPNIVHSHLSWNGGNNLVTILQSHPEHRVAQGFYNDSVLFDQRLFTHICLKRCKGRNLFLIFYGFFEVFRRKKGPNDLLFYNLIVKASDSLKKQGPVRSPACIENILYMFGAIQLMRLLAIQQTLNSIGFFRLI